MKSLRITFPVAAALLLAFTACDKEDDVNVTPPEAVTKTLAQKYPNAQVYEWEFWASPQHGGMYEAELVYNGNYTENGQDIALNNVRAEVYIGGDGTWIRTQFDMTRDYFTNASTIPQAVKEAIAAKGWQVESVELYDESKLNDHFYIEFDEPDTGLVLNFDGKPL